MAAAWHDAGVEAVAVSNATLTQAYTTTSGADYLVVRVYSNGGPSPAVSGITFNGDAMASVIQQPDDVGVNRVSIFILRAPDIGTYNVVVTMAATTDVIGVWIRSAEGIEQASDAASHRTAVGENEASSTPLSIDVGSQSGDLVIDAVAGYNGTWTASAGAGQTEELDSDPGGGTLAALASSETASGTTTTMSWTVDSGSLDFFAHAAVALVPAAGGGGGGSAYAIFYVRA